LGIPAGTKESEWRDQGTGADTCHHLKLRPLAPTTESNERSCAKRARRPAA
jgi:hypothetical protein